MVTIAHPTRSAICQAVCEAMEVLQLVPIDKGTCRQALPHGPLAIDDPEKRRLMLTAFARPAGVKIHDVAWLSNEDVMYLQGCLRGAPTQPHCLAHTCRIPAIAQIVKVLKESLV